jgi:hypothetical protein
MSIRGASLAPAELHTYSGMVFEVRPFWLWLTGTRRRRCWRAGADRRNDAPGPADGRTQPSEPAVIAPLATGQRWSLSYATLLVVISSAFALAPKA